MSDLVQFQYDRLFSTGDPHSTDLKASDLEGLRPRLEAIQQDFNARREEGDLAFMDLHEEQEQLQEILKFVLRVKGDYDDIVVLGIGGSALGAKALYQALDDLNANLQSGQDRGHPRLFIPDNVDPHLLLSVRRLIDPKRTLVVVISKSGGTLETMAGFLTFKGLLEEAHGSDWTRHLVIITDPEHGYLRKWATDANIRTFPVPTKVGGRFSVFTPVGLVPLALAGVDVASLLEGQSKLAASIKDGDVLEHPAFTFGALGYLLDTVANRNQVVIFPYADRLRETAFWFRQLWAESLGKAVHLDGSEARVGTTPVFASGATDQHSQVQLYIEGPADKAIVFLEVTQPEEDFTLPEVSGPLESLSYLSGRSLHELLQIELNATRDALTEAGKPNATLVLPSLSPQSLGALYFCLMAATAVAGELYRINTFDQPGVEHGKKKINAALGK